MTLQLHASEPLSAQTGPVDGDSATVTTAAFSPPAKALLVALVVVNEPVGGQDTTVTVSSMGGLTWTRRGRKNINAGSTGGAGQSGTDAEVWTANTDSGAPGSITATADVDLAGGTGANWYVRIKVMVVTDTGGTTPVPGNVAAASNASGLPSVTVPSVANGSYVFAVCADWAAIAGGVSYGSGQSNIDGGSNADYAWHIWRLTNPKSGAGNQTMNITDLGGQNFNIVGFEAAPAAGGDATVSAVAMDATGDAPAPVVSVFPANTTLIDDFNRADSQTVATGAGSAIWQTVPITSGVTLCNTFGNALDFSGAGNQCVSVSQFGPNMDITWEIAGNTSLTSPNYLAFFFSLLPGGASFPDATFSGYALLMGLAGTNVWSLQKYTGGSGSSVGNFGTQAIGLGDQIGISRRGSSVTAYRKPSGGAWTVIGTLTDSTYQRSGYIGFEINQNGIDNLSGGTIAGTGDATINAVAMDATGDLMGDIPMSSEVLAVAVVSLGDVPAAVVTGGGSGSSTVTAVAMVALGDVPTAVVTGTGDGAVVAVVMAATGDLVAATVTGSSGSNVTAVPVDATGDFVIPGISGLVFVTSGDVHVHVLAREKNVIIPPR